MPLPERNAQGCGAVVGLRVHADLASKINKLRREIKTYVFNGIVARAGDLCKEAGAKRVLPLPVSVPSHCALMKPAAEQLSEQFLTLSFNTPAVDVINNVDVKIEAEAENIQQALIKQLYSPVRWTETIEKMSENGVTKVLELGPGKVLQGLIKRIDKTIECVAVNDQASLEKAISLVS